jgi:hypothetical protein
MQSDRKQLNSLKILYGPSFSIWRPSRLVDEGLVKAFKSEGNTIVGQYCRQAQSSECNVYGGDWLQGSSFDSKCADCEGKSRKFWGKVQDSVLDVHVLKREFDFIESTRDLHQDELENFVFENIAFGLLARDIVRNNSLADDVNLVPDYVSRMRIQIGNLLVMYQQYEKSIIVNEPDRVVSNDSFYGMWRVLQYAAEKHKVPFYSHWPLTSERVVFAQNEPAMDRNLSAAFKGVGLGIELDGKSQNYLANWQKGKRSLAIPIKTRSEEKGLNILLDRIGKRKAFVLVSNVVWDLASLNKDVAFPSIRDWVVQTVDWFSKNPDLYLIIKPHPAEMYKYNPVTRETINNYLSKDLPSNIELLPYQTHSIQTIVDEISPSAFLVHTSTVGYEVAMLGRRSICVGAPIYKGLGFTVDAEDPEDYFNEIRVASKGDGTIEAKRAELARKFSSLYNHRFQVFVGNMTVGRKSFLDNFQKIAKDANSGLYYVLHQIQAGQPIVDETSIPPVSGDEN